MISPTPSKKQEHQMQRINNVQERRSLLVVPFCVLMLASCGSSVNHIDAGKQFLETKQYDQALSEFNQAIQQDPNQYYAYFGQGYAYVNSNHPDLALVSAQKALQLKSDDAGSYFVKAQ